MADGFQTHPDDLRRARDVYREEGHQTGIVAGTLVSGIGGGQVGRAWQGMADSYQQAMAQLETSARDYSLAVTAMGEALDSTADLYASHDEAAAVHLFRAAGHVG